MPTNIDIELKYKNQLVAGVDEAGRGPFAGPVIASAVIIDQNNIIEGIKDSKKLSGKNREILYAKITEYYHYAVGIVEPAEIDQINILQATIKACRLAISNLPVSPDIILVDGNMKFGSPNFISIVNGDNLSTSIAAASIIAKVTRDRLMLKLSEAFPEYLWHKNFGYPTQEHVAAIRLHGLSPHHRKSFRVR